jgi:hypothetical protein
MRKLPHHVKVYDIWINFRKKFYIKFKKKRIKLNKKKLTSRHRFLIFYTLNLYKITPSGRPTSYQTNRLKLNIIFVCNSKIKKNIKIK